MSAAAAPAYYLLMPDGSEVPTTERRVNRELRRGAVGIVSKTSDIMIVVVAR